MQCKFFTISIYGENVDEATEKMNAFLRGHRVLSLRKEFVNDGANSLWCCCVEYVEGSTGKNSTGHSGNERESEKIDYKTLLSEEEFTRYVMYRQCRNLLAEQEGLPPYTIFLNAHLADMAKDAQLDLEGLGRITGVSKEKIGKYGTKFWALVTERKTHNDTKGESVSGDN